MKRIWVWLFLLLAAPAAWAQGYTHRNITLGSTGRPVGGATITVCTEAADPSVRPCSPLATIYTDDTLATTKSNPFTSDSLGNYSFSAPPGRYVVTITGAGTAGYGELVTLPCVPGAAGCDEEAALKPPTTGAVQYVAPWGNDANDGLSLGTAKLTIKAALRSLPKGDLSSDPQYPGIPTAGGGTVFVYSTPSQTAACSDVSGEGIWLMGSGDPNWNSPPSGWLRRSSASGSGPIHIFGMGPYSNTNSTTFGQARLTCGSATNPAFWLSNVSGFWLSNIGATGAKNGMLLNVKSDGVYSTTGEAASNIVLRNVYFTVDTADATKGPTIGIGGNVLWALFENLALQGNVNAATGTKERAALYINGDGATGPGLLVFDKLNLVHGGVLYSKASGSVSNADFKNIMMQGGTNCPPVIDIQGTGTFEARIENVNNSDCSPRAPHVRVQEGNSPHKTIYSTNNVTAPGMIEGPVTIVGVAGREKPQTDSNRIQYGAGNALAHVSPEAKNQQVLTRQNDAARRLFPPVFARFTNLANQDPTSWTSLCASGTVVTTGQTDPLGGTGAGKVSHPTSVGCVNVYSAASTTLTAGDYLYAGVWVKQASGAGVDDSSGDFGIGVTHSSSTDTMRFITGSSYASFTSSGGDRVISGNTNKAQTDGEWEWVWVLGQVVNPGTSGTLTAYLRVQGNTRPMLYAFPVFVRVPASSVAVVAAPTVSAASRSGNTVTIDTSAAHNLTIGQPLIVSACSVADYNGRVVVNAASDSDTFSYYVGTSGTDSATGCVVTTVNDSEMAAWARDAATWSNQAAVGSTALLPSQPLWARHADMTGVKVVDGRVYTTIQAAIDALPSSGGTVFVPRGATVDTSTVNLTKPVHLAFDCGTFTYSGTTAFLSASGPTEGVHVSGCGRGGSGVTSGTVISITNTSANGFNFTNAPGVLVEALTLKGPGSGTGKGIVISGTRPGLRDVLVSAFGGDGITIDGTTINSNTGVLERVRSQFNGGNGFVFTGPDGNVQTCVGCDAAANGGDGFLIASSGNVLVGTNSNSNGSGIGYHITGDTNRGIGVFSDAPNAPETTGVQFDAGADFNFFVLATASMPVVDNGGGNRYLGHSGNSTKWNSVFAQVLNGGVFQTSSTNPATSGTLRLARVDTIEWRNEGNTANLPLGVNASNQLTFNGVPLGSGTGCTPTGANNQVLTDDGAGACVSEPNLTFDGTTLAVGGTSVLKDPGGNGIAVRTASATTTARSLANDANGFLTWSNADGVAGNPTPSFANKGRTFIKDLPNLLDPTTADTNKFQVKFPNNVTITRISCSTDTGTVSINFDERAEGTPNTAGTDVLSAALVCDTDTQATTTFANASIAANAPLNLQITATSGMPGVVRGHVEYRID